MAVQVWVGEKPEHPNERRAIVALANGLERLENMYMLLANFNVGGRNIDLVVIKHDALFLIELKHCDGKLFGGVNGPWYVESANGERKRLNPGRKNPYNQIIAYYYSLTNFLNDHRTDIVSGSKAESINFRTCKRVVVFAPTIQEGSEIELDWRVDLKGIDELPSFLVTERSPEIDLSEEEMLAIPKLLGCTRWKDVNELITVPPVTKEEPVPHVDRQGKDDTETRPSSTATKPSNTLLSRLPQPLRLTTGRLALVISLLTILVVMVLLLNQPFWSGRTATTLPTIVPGPAAGGVGVFVDGEDERTGGCVWSGYQSVGKRWDDDAQRWISVGVDGTVAELSPEIIVTLEQVDYCHDQIVLTWSVHNKSDDTVRFPLSSSNIVIRDPLGNEYTLDEEISTSTVVNVKPGDQKQTTAVVPRPVSQNTPSLLVRLREQPFGEASWLVSLEGN